MTDRTPAQAVELSRWLMIGVTSLAALILLGLVALQYQIIRQDDQLDRVEVSVVKLNSFVDELRERQASETTIAQEKAIADAVAEVPRIKTILCEAFPDTSPCQD